MSYQVYLAIENDKGEKNMKGKVNSITDVEVGEKYYIADVIHFKVWNAKYNINYKRRFEIMLIHGMLFHDFDSANEYLLSICKEGVQQ